MDKVKALYPKNRIEGPREKHAGLIIE